MRVWSYVITTDRGSAPNYDGHAVTLTICKPRIRARATKGDLVLAFNGWPLSRNPHSVRWAGIVSDVLPLEKYWDDPRFRHKRPGRSETPDNIYKVVDGRWVQVPNGSHGEGNIRTDLSGKNALIFSSAWHFGGDQPELPDAFDLRVVTNRRTEPLREISDEQWLELRAWLDAHDCGLPHARGGSVCRAHSKAPEVHATCQR